MTRLGIRNLYPNLPGPPLAHALIAAARPFTLLAPLLGVVIAAALAVETHVTTWPTILAHPIDDALGITAILLTQVASNWVNQGSDIVEDRINKPYRPAPRGAITPGALLRNGELLMVAAIILATVHSWSFGILIAALNLLSWLYSIPPTRLKRRTYLGNLGVALARGQLGIVTAWSIYATPWTLAPWIIGFVLFLYLLGATTAKDIPDMLGDRTAGVNTLPTRHGPRIATHLSAPFILSPIITVPLVGTILNLHISVIAYAFLVAADIWFLLLLYLQPPKENMILEGSRAWTWMYAVLLLLMITLASGI